MREAVGRIATEIQNVSVLVPEGNRDRKRREGAGEGEERGGGGGGRDNLQKSSEGNVTYITAENQQAPRSTVIDYRPPNLIHHYHRRSLLVLSPYLWPSTSCGHICEDKANSDVQNQPSGVRPPSGSIFIDERARYHV